MVLAVAQSNAQTVTGRITVGGTQLAARGAGVILLDSMGRPATAALADSFGRYSILARYPGSYRLRVHGRSGSPMVETSAISLHPGATVELDIPLSLVPTTLGTVIVVGKSIVDAPPGNPAKYDEFLRRKKLGFGRFLTRADIEKSGMNMVHDLLRGIPGMLVSVSGSHPTIQSKRCPGSSIPGLDPAALAGQSAGPDTKQQPMLFVDGIRVRDIASLSNIHPGQIEAMEIYQGAAQVPAEAKGDACAAIFIWLRTGS
ncbi:MAG: TonB-dependent receptor plug domain-containing protein [Gemmatimonadaceae bacterium]